MARKLLLDTSFLIHLASKPVKGFERVLDELGLAGVVVLEDSVKELERISKGRSRVKASGAMLAMERLSKFEVLASPAQGCVDDKIVALALEKGFVVATMDRRLRRRLRSLGVTTVTCRDDVVFAEG